MKLLNRRKKTKLVGMYGNMHTTGTKEAKEKGKESEFRAVWWWKGQAMRAKKTKR